MCAYTLKSILTSRGLDQLLVFRRNFDLPTFGKTLRMEMYGYILIVDMIQ